ncbi:hypothetical protein [Melittangium boletus]|uniref:hypothetical protein n=1 Tax=Melittangium boletus TaxID=83453 RepID=UPI003DA2B78A
MGRKQEWIIFLLASGCASSPMAVDVERKASRGPWPEVPAVEMTDEETSVPIGLLRDVANALLKRAGATACDSMKRRPIEGLSMEYCSTIYVAGEGESLSWRVTEPIRGEFAVCRPSPQVEDADYPASNVWVVGYVHNHPCAAPPSSKDLANWPTDAFDPYVSMAEVRMVPGNPRPLTHRNNAIEMASALVAQRQDGTRFFLRYFTTGEVQQWSETRSRWILLDRCTPRGSNPFSAMPQCEKGPLRLLRE